jgi:hypothetical protein
MVPMRFTVVRTEAFKVTAKWYSLCIDVTMDTFWKDGKYIPN